MVATPPDPRPRCAIARTTAPPPPGPPPRSPRPPRRATRPHSPEIPRRLQSRPWPARRARPASPPVLRPTTPPCRSAAHRSPGATPRRAPSPESPPRWPPTAVARIHRARDDVAVALRLRWPPLAPHPPVRPAAAEPGDTGKSTLRKLKGVCLGWRAPAEEESRRHPRAPEPTAQGVLKENIAVAVFRL
jgi:hypothetical protein